MLFSFSIRATEPGGALATAIIAGDHSTIQKQLEKKPDLDVYFTDGRTPLLLACKNGDSKLVALLIDAGADVNFPARDLTSPLITAAKSGHDEIVQLLLSKGADISQTDAQNMNAYDHALEAKSKTTGQTLEFDRLLDRLHEAMASYAEANR
jgi:ankyrin repeat protein